MTILSLCRFLFKIYIISYRNIGEFVCSKISRAKFDFLHKCLKFSNFFFSFSTMYLILARIVWKDVPRKIDTLYLNANPDNTKLFIFWSLSRFWNIIGFYYSWTNNLIDLKLILSTITWNAKQKNFKLKKCHTYVICKILTYKTTLRCVKISKESI